MSDSRGTHVFGEHLWIVVETAKDCRPSSCDEVQARSILVAVLQCIDLVGGLAVAVQPRAASPQHPVIANRTRNSTRGPAPMNPVQRHYGGGQSGRPPGDADSGFWLHQYERVDDLYDRCEVVRRAGAYLAGLVMRNPDAPAGAWTEQDVRAQVLVEGSGWPVKDVAERFRLDVRMVALWRIDDGRHPLDGKPWTPPATNLFAAQAAREMRAAGLTSADIARALKRNANTVRAWTTNRRRTAA